MIPGEEQRDGDRQEWRHQQRHISQVPGNQTSLGAQQHGRIVGKQAHGEQVRANPPPGRRERSLVRGDFENQKDQNSGGDAEGGQCQECHFAASRCIPCARLGNRFTSSSTISPRTKLKRSASSSNNIRESGFTSRPRTRPGSIRSRSGSPRSNARSSHAASSPRFPTWLANSAATSMPTPPMLGPSSGNTPTPPAASAVTNSLRQATSHAPDVREAGSGDRCAPNGTKISHPEVKAVPDKNHTRGIGRSRQAVLGKRNAGASLPLLLNAIARRKVSVGSRSGDSEKHDKCQQLLEVDIHARETLLGLSICLIQVS